MDRRLALHEVRDRADLRRALAGAARGAERDRDAGDQDVAGARARKEVRRGAGDSNVEGGNLKTTAEDAVVIDGADVALPARPKDRNGVNWAQALALAGALAADLRREETFRMVGPGGEEIVVRVAPGADLGRKIKVTGPDGTVKREITQRERLEKQLLAIGIEVSACPEAKKVTHKFCDGCGKLFIRTGRKWRRACADCHKCNDCGKPINNKSVWTPAVQASRNFRHPICGRCSILKVGRARTPEQRSLAGRKGYAALSPEQRRANLSKGASATTNEQRRQNAISGNMRRVRSPEQRAEWARMVGRGRAQMSPYQRSEAVRKGRAALTVEQRSEIARKAYATRKSKAKVSAGETE